MKPYSESCEQNRKPILAVLQQYFARATRVLETGSGTGQHAVYFAAELPHLVWQTSERQENHPGIEQWRQSAVLPNVRAPLDLDVLNAWPRQVASALPYVSLRTQCGNPMVPCLNQIAALRSR